MSGLVYRPPLSSAVFACLLLTVAAFPANAGRGAITAEPTRPSLKIFESEPVVVEKYIIRNTMDDDVSLGDITELLFPVAKTDTKSDALRKGVVDQGFPGECGFVLFDGGTCTVQASFRVKDNDPTDKDPKVDFGLWTVYIRVPWVVIRGAPGMGVAFSDATLIAVKDDPVGVPEPAIWALMGFGLGVVGTALRGRTHRGRISA